MTDYIVAIPSYKRSKSIVKNTLNVLNKKNVAPDRIFLFVANKDEKEDYLQNVPEHLYGEIVVGAAGLRNQRNFITDYFSESQPIVEMDDDVKDVSILVPGKGETRAEIQKSSRLVPMRDLDSFFQEAFYRLISHDLSLSGSPIMKGKPSQKPMAYLWGVYPVNNPYFMTNSITKDLRFIVGPMWGKINRKDRRLKLERNEKEDFERTLRHYKLDKAVVRFNNITISTSYYSTPGGMQAEDKDRYKEAEKSANYLVKKFPGYTKKWYKGKTKRPEIKVRDHSIK